MFEALLRIQIEEFLSTIPADDSDSVTALAEILLQQHTEGSNNPPDHALIKAFHQHDPQKRRVYCLCFLELLYYYGWRVTQLHTSYQAG